MSNIKKLFTLVIAFSIIFTCLATPASAIGEDNVISVSTYDEFKTALTSNSTVDYTIKLLNNITIDTSINMIGKCALVLDLNGWTLTFNPKTASDTYAFYIKSEYTYYIKNEFSTGGFINLSPSNVFIYAPGRTAVVSGNFNGDLTCNSSIYFNNATVTGPVKCANLYVYADKTVSLGDTLGVSTSMEMLSDTSAISVTGETTIGKKATIYSNAVFNANVSIAKNMVYTSGESIVTNIYGGIFKGELSVSDNFEFKYATSKYYIYIMGGYFYDKVTLNNPSTNNLGSMQTDITKGNFYKKAVIDCPNAKITGGNFSYTFLDQDGNELKSLITRYNAKINPPTIPKIEGKIFTGWSGYTNDMKVTTTTVFQAEYADGNDADTDKYSEVNTPVQYTKDGVAIEGATKIYTDIAYPNIIFDADKGTESENTNIYGLSEYIPAANGDVFKVSAVNTSIYNAVAFAAAYDSEYKFLGSFTHNDHTKLSFVGRRGDHYSIGLLNDKRYHMDVEFQIPGGEAGSIFENIAYIRVKAFKCLDTRTMAQYLMNDKDFYVAYMGNKDAPAPVTTIHHLKNDQNDKFNQPLSSDVGEIDGETGTNIKDVLYLKKLLAGYEGYTAGLCNSDLNYDGEINIKDVIYYRRYIAGWSNYKLEKPKFIALSFDDAPDCMANVLTLFENYRQYNVRGTYMLNGSRVSNENMSLLKKAVSLGLDLGNHSTFHGWGLCLGNNGYGNYSEMKNEVNFTQDIIYNATKTTNSFFRAPFFALPKEMKNAISDMVFIEGTTSSDTSSISAEGSASWQLSQVKDGNIILLHDNSKLVNTLNIIIPDLLAKGYKFVTIDELFKYNNIIPKPGYIYTNVFNPRAA